MRPKLGNEYIILDDYAIVVVISKKYGRKEIKIDIEDVRRCKRHTWGITFAPSNQSFYGRTSFAKPKRSMELSRFIMRIKNKKLVDHRNHETLDDRKDNLRICSHRVNNFNRKGVCKNSFLGIRGVRYSERLKKYLVRFKQKHIACCNTLDEAKILAERTRAIYES